MNRFLFKSACWVLFFIAATITADAQNLTWQADSIQSEGVGDWRRVRYIVPQGHEKTSERIPVLYLFHGLTGSEVDWTSRTKILDYLRQLDLNLVVIMPDADDSWYQNDLDGRAYFDFVANELPVWAHEHLGADTTRQAVAGLSMGGYGALLLAMTYPDRYFMAGSFSGAIVFPEALAGMNTEPSSNDLLMWTMWKAFGDDNHPNRTTGDLYRLVDRAEADQLPYIYLRHGIQDGYKDFLRGHRKIVEKLAAREWPYEYHEVPGAHSWPFWDGAISEFLSLLKSRWPSE